VLSIEFYSVMDGMMVRAHAVPTRGAPLSPQGQWDAIQRVVQVGDMEDQGLPQAVLHAVVELIQRYPELIAGAIE